MERNGTQEPKRSELFPHQPIDCAVPAVSPHRRPLHPRGLCFSLHCTLCAHEYTTQHTPAHGGRHATGLDLLCMTSPLFSTALYCPLLSAASRHAAPRAPTRTQCCCCLSLRPPPLFCHSSAKRRRALESYFLLVFSPIQFVDVALILLFRTFGRRFAEQFRRLVPSRRVASRYDFHGGRAENRYSVASDRQRASAA